MNNNHLIGMKFCVFCDILCILGTIPSSIGSLSSMANLQLNNNAITGISHMCELFITLF